MEASFKWENGYQLVLVNRRGLVLQPISDEALKRIQSTSQLVWPIYPFVFRHRNSCCQEPFETGKCFRPREEDANSTLPMARSHRDVDPANEDMSVLVFRRLSLGLTFHFSDGYAFSGQVRRYECFHIRARHTRFMRKIAIPSRSCILFAHESAFRCVFSIGTLLQLSVGKRSISTMQNCCTMFCLKLGVRPSGVN